MTSHTPIADPIDLVLDAAWVAKSQGQDPELAAQARAAELGITLPGEDFCLHGEYQNPCLKCEAVFA